MQSYVFVQVEHKYGCVNSILPPRGHTRVFDVMEEGSCKKEDKEVT